MSQDSSLVGAFDLNSQTGVMSILASIRGSKLLAPEKNELRDLVFLYTNGGGDASVRIALEQKLATYQIVPIQVMPSIQTGPVLPFGSYRPTPTFRKTPQVATTPTPVVAPAIPVVNVPPVASVIATPVASQPQPAPVTPLPGAGQAPVPVNGEINYIERIRQIKTAVNSKVGNPVNLVDINNEVGREYMNALLEAMKKLSSGAVSEMEPAMKRLETAYIAVEVAIAGHNKTESTNPAIVAPVIATMEPIIIPTPVRQMPVSAPIIEKEIPPPTTVTMQDLPARPLPPVPEVVTSVPTPQSVEEISVPETLVPDDVPLPPVAEPSEPVLEPMSFALVDRQKILTPHDLPEVFGVPIGENVDPLSTKDVDDGLNQLLGDWALFKKSGLFGTGPKGREHPLFKKIAGLQVPLLLAGRFDGATQEIRQSITDYMNGWRYEQGIIYQPGETFEKYLRRVIKHIIDLQKKHKQP